ncbi:MAG: hypothetical protein M3P26_16980 [Gemmatimonadota bacterium]|nr:hypothetical protein [Gemmatimonadota bacterium]
MGKTRAVRPGGWLHQYLISSVATRSLFAEAEYSREAALAIVDRDKTDCFRLLRQIQRGRQMPAVRAARVAGIEHPRNFVGEGPLGKDPRNRYWQIAVGGRSWPTRP